MENNSNKTENKTDFIKVRIGGRKSLNLNVRTSSLRPIRSFGKMKSIRPTKPAPEAVMGSGEKNTEQNSES